MAKRITPGSRIKKGETIGEWRKRMKIKGEKLRRDSRICALGKSEVDGKWYGWSHRAYHGFKTRAAAKRFAESVQ